MSELQNLIKDCEKYIDIRGIDETIINAYLDTCQLAKNDGDITTMLECTARSKAIVNQFCLKQFGMDIWGIEKFAQANKTEIELVNQYYQILKLESYDKFESFIFYMEKNRAWQKRFYQPRRKTLNVVAQDLEDLEQRKIKFYGLSMPSRVGKSTICIFFLAWIMLRRPNSHSAMGGHSGILAKGFYKELMNLVSTPEYTFGELFGYYHPKYKSVVTDKSADEFTITLGDPDRFATITCRGIDGTWIGAVDVSADGYLYVDDLVRDREHSLSPTRMENTYQEYLNKMVDRKNDGARELMVGTLWNVLDPLERLRKQYEKDPQYRFRQIPALNENDESNFNYEINGFSTEYYRDMRDKLENAEWMAKFMQKPYVREGLLFPTDNLRYFNGVLPDGDCRYIGVTDIAWGGGDSLSMPIGVEYDNGDVYIIGWVFNKGTKEVTVPLVVGRIIENGIRQTRFEGNVGGDLYCQYVDEKLQEQGYKCSCSSRKAPNKVEKLAKIIAYSDDVKRKFIFLDTHRRTQEQMQKDAELGIKRYYRDDEYQAAMDELTMFVSIGGNEHDDAADGITQLEMFIENPENTAVAEATLNPFRRY